MQFPICPCGVVLLKFQNFPPPLWYCMHLPNYLGLSFCFNKDTNFIPFVQEICKLFLLNFQTSFGLFCCNKVTYFI